MGVDVTIYEGRELRTFQNVEKLQTSGGQLWVPEELVEQSVKGVEDGVYSDITYRQWGATGETEGLFHLASNITLGVSGSDFQVQFKSKGVEYNYIAFTGSSMKYKYGTNEVTVYNSVTGWVDNDYRSIDIIENADPYFEDWLWDNVDNYKDKQIFNRYMNFIFREILDKGGLSGQNKDLEWMFNNIHSILGGI